MPYDIPKLTENPFVLISGFVLVITAVLIAVVLSRYAAEAYKGNRKKATLFFAGITAFVTLMLFCFFGCAATTVKGIIFCLLLAFSSYEDIKTRECEDYVHLMIVIAAFIGTDNVYDDLRDKLIAKGVPKEEIAYIHSANTEMQKKELFGKVRSGQVRVLIGSTQKMGAGTNVQKKLIALHHLDCPWRPSDLQQREGRIIRQGNDNPEVEIFTYVTEDIDDLLIKAIDAPTKKEKRKADRAGR